MTRVQEHVGTAVISVHCPADGRLVGTVPRATSAEVRAAAADLRRAQPEERRGDGADDRPYALLKFCRPQAQVSERFNLPAEPYWYPVSRRKALLQSRVMRLLGAQDWRRRIGLR